MRNRPIILGAAALLVAAAAFGAEPTRWLNVQVNAVEDKTEVELHLPFALGATALESVHGHGLEGGKVSLGNHHVDVDWPAILAEAASRRCTCATSTCGTRSRSCATCWRAARGGTRSFKRVRSDLTPTRAAACYCGNSMKTTRSRTALVAGASSLVGRSLLAQLLEPPRYGLVHVLLRRTVAELPAHRKIKVMTDAFDRLPPLPRVDDVYIALGTTIKTAGSQAAFRRVDFDAVVNTARVAKTSGAWRLLVVSALGADPKSRVFYNRVKGEMQQAITGLGYETVVIAQPSLLLGSPGSTQRTRAGRRAAISLRQASPSEACACVPSAR